MASTSIPKLCIVMEYMELGSLYDVSAVKSILSSAETELINGFLL